MPYPAAFPADACSDPGRVVSPSNPLIPGAAIRLGTLLAAVVILGSPAVARSVCVTPDPAQCTISDWDGTSAFFACPGTQSGVDRRTITIRDLNGVPMAGVRVEVDLSQVPGLCIDPVNSGLVGVTDANGQFVLDPQVGGCGHGHIEIRAGDTVIRTYERVVSTDWDGTTADGQVDGADYAWASTYLNTSTYAECVDYTGNGTPSGLFESSIFQTSMAAGDANPNGCGGSGYSNFVSWYGGTHWNGAQSRWEALSGGTWTFDSGVGTDFDFGAPDVDPSKNPLLHAHMEGWVGVDESGGGEWSDQRALSDLPPVLDPEGCTFLSDSVLVLADLVTGGHTINQENFGASPWIVLQPGDVGRTGKLIECDGYVELPFLDYIFPRVVCQWRVGGGPVSAWTPLPYIPRLPRVDCSGPERHWSFDVSQVVPTGVTEVRIGLGVESLCSLYPGCVGATNSTPWYDNVRFGVYDSPGADSDGDGVLDAEENGAPNSGDGNSDGTLDAYQADVISYLDAHTSQYVTVEITGAAGAPTEKAGFGCLTSRDVSAYPTPPLGVTFPCGVFEMAFSWLDARSSIQVKLDLPSGCLPTAYYKYGPTPGNPTPHWYNFAWDGTTGAQFGLGSVTLTFVDGERGDDDLVQNTQVLDLGGPALVDSCGCTLSWFPNPGAPSARTSQAAAYDPSHHEMVVFGGTDGGNYLSDTWTIDDGGLVDALSPAHHPTGRVGAGMVYCTALKKIILHGGVNASGYLNDTWAWDGTDWTQIASDGPATSDMGIANDDAIDRVILYGGAAATGRAASTWSFDGSSWTLLESNSPPGYRSYHKMVYSPADKLLHVFGGQLPGGTDTRDNWTFDGVSTWTDQGASGPSARLHFAMASEDGCGGIYLYGGTEGSTVYDDLWVLDGGTWQSLSVPGSPGQRSAGTLTYLPERQSVALVGGTDGDGSTTSSVEFLGCPARVTSAPDRPEVPAPQRLWAAPNPFRATTEISYRLDVSAPVTVEVFDLSGRLLTTLVDGAPQASGAHHLSWDARDAVGRPVATGIYFVRVRTPEATMSRRIVRIR